MKKKLLIAYLKMVNSDMIVARMKAFENLDDKNSLGDWVENFDNAIEKFDEAHEKIKNLIAQLMRD